jgi:signal transduction histidine kinase
VWNRDGTTLGRSGGRLQILSWPALLIGIVVVRIVLPLAAKPDSFLFSLSAVGYFLLLLLATGFAVRNAIQNTLGMRPFWGSVAIAHGLWALDQSLFLYYEHVLHIDVPDDSIADPLLFLHIIPIMAAVAFAGWNLHGRKLCRAILSSLLVLLFWSFLYVYGVFPYQYLFSNGISYALRFDTLYLLENLVLIVVLAVSSFRAQAPWKEIYLHLLGACALYALSSTVANLAIDSGGYVSGKLYGAGLIGSACWFVWMPLRARQLAITEQEVTLPDNKPSSGASAWAMVLVAVIAIPIVLELFRRDEAQGMRTFHLFVAVAAIVCLAGAAYTNEYLAKSELASDLSLANDRLRLAVEAGNSVGWEWDIKSGRGRWFGDLQNTFGIPSNSYFGSMDDFRNRIYSEDQELVRKAVADARRNRIPYSAEFRIVRPDGTLRWLASSGTFHYAHDGQPERMLGMAVDVTERKHSQAALASLGRRLIEAQERERTRIARELHDDIGQRLAMLTTDLGQLPDDYPDLAVEIRSRVSELWKQTSELATDIQFLSHKLHSSKLQYLGIAAAMRGFCREFGEQQNVKVDFRSHDLPGTLPPDLSLCLFRVLQEALHNSAKYSGVREFDVRLWGAGEEIHLTVSDSGLGFDVDAVKHSSGLGLVSMEERLKLLSGTLSIDTQPNLGTTIHARGPLRTSSDFMTAAG